MARNGAMLGVLPSPRGRALAPNPGSAASPTQDRPAGVAAHTPALLKGTGARQAGIDRAPRATAAAAVGAMSLRQAAQAAGRQLRGRTASLQHQQQRLAGKRWGGLGAAESLVIALGRDATAPRWALQRGGGCGRWRRRPSLPLPLNLLLAQQELQQLSIRTPPTAPALQATCRSSPTSMLRSGARGGSTLRTSSGELGWASGRGAERVYGMNTHDE